MKQKLTLLLTAFLLLTGMTSWGQLRTEASIDFSEQGYSNAQEMDGVVIDIDDNVTVVFNKGTSNNPPKYYTSGSAIRAYAGNNFEISSNGTITAITLTFSTTDGGVNAITTDVGTFESPSWTGFSSDVVFTIEGTSGQRRIQAIAVTYSGGGGQQQTVATPTFSPVGGAYYEPQSVTISCATEGSTICYTTDGSEPNENSAQFSVPLTINQTTTLKAKAFRSGYTASQVATAIYTFPSLISISEARALANNEYALVQGVVTFIDGRNVYIQDATGGIDLYLNAPHSTVAIGDMVKAYGKKTVFNGLVELTGINGNNANEFSILSSGNTLPLAVKTIAEILEGGTDALQCTRVKIENAVIGAINPSSNTPLTQGENSINIYKVPELADIVEGDQVDVIGVVGYYNAAQIRVAQASDVVLSYNPEPTLSVSPTSMSGFSYMLGEGPSMVQSFTVTGGHLESSVTLASTQHFEIGTSASGPFSSNISTSVVSGSISQTYYVRMKAGLDLGDYTGSVNITCGELSASVALSGVVGRHPAMLTANPAALSGFTYDYEQGGPSGIQSFLVSGDYLTDNVAIYPSENFEVSTQPATLFTPENPAMIFIPNSGQFYDISIYVRLKAGLENGNYNEQLYAVTEGADTLFINVSGSVTGGTPTPPDPPTPPTPGDGNYVRISDLSSLTNGAYIVFAARFDGNATDYYAMSNQSSGKPTGVLFTSATANENEVLPASIVDEEDSYYWVVGVTNNGYTFTNATGEMIGYTSSTNFATGGDNTEWTIAIQTSEGGAMVPNYTGFVVGNVNNTVRAFALNSSHNFGPYHTQNIAGSNYNFFLDIFVKSEGGEPPVPPTPTVATPTFTPAAGTYSEAQEVAISCTTEGATIYYSTISENGPWTEYTAAITVDESMTIWAYAEKEDYNDSPVAEATYTIQMGIVTIFNQDWEGEMNGWTFVNVEGEMNWTVATYQGNHYAYANGYSSGAAHANEDWCISPAFNLNAISNPVLSFRTAKNYTGNDLEVFISNDYDGEDPTNATWQPLTCALSQGSWNWVESGDISLSTFSGNECYIGFKYTCTDESAAGWEVDDILLIGQTSESVVNVTPLVLTGFTYVEGNGPSAEQSFTVSAFNISNNVVISPTVDYEISLTSGNAFTPQASLTLSHSGGTIDEITVYVRMKAGLAVGEYNDEDITIACADVDDIEVTCSGNVTAQPVPGDDYVRISGVSELVAGNRVILASRYNETDNAYLAIGNAPSSGKLPTTEFTSEMNGADEIIPASILGDEDSYYWTVGITEDGYTFTNANGNMIGYGSNGTNLVLNGEKTVWTIEAGVSAPESMVPGYFGFSIVNATATSRAMALRVSETESIVKAYSTSNMTSGEYNFFLDIFMQGEGGVPPTPTVADPTFNPVGGSYYEAQDVTISCTTTDATIYYSLDSENGPWEEYDGAITVDESMTIWAYAEKEGYNDSPVVSAEYVIEAGLNIIFWQEWENDWDPWHGWTERCTMGDSLWRVASYGGNHYAYANGYNHPQTIDWLISPAFDLDSYSEVVLTFNTAKNYNGPDLEVFFSNNYDGQDPDSATWIPLQCELSQGGWNWVASGDISLDEFSGSNCHIGFKYTCDEDAAGWEVDDIKLASGSTSPTPTLIATPNYLGDFSYVVGHGPSESQSYVLSGVNLNDEGYIHIVSCSWYEISLDNETFTEILEFPCTELPATVYVRMMEGLEPNTYDGVYIANIYGYENDDANVAVNVSGIVHYENEPTMSALMPLYVQGNNGSNNNRVPVAAPVHFNNLEPNTTYHYTNQFVDDNDGPETAGAGNVIYADPEGFYRSTSPSLSTEGGYGVFTTDDEGHALVWLMNEPTANARFTPGNHVYMRVRLNDGAYGVNVLHTFTSEDYATVLNFGTENDEYSGTAFYAKSNEAPMSFAIMYDADNYRPVYATSIETIGVDFGSINQYANFYKDEVAGKDGWFGGILPNVNESGIVGIVISSLDFQNLHEYASENGQWAPEANTVNPTNGLDEPIFIDLTEDGVKEQLEANVTIWNTGNEFIIENGDNAKYAMTVYNVMGQQMMQHQINAGSTERISHNLAKGVYVISLQNSQNTVSAKVIVR